MVFFWLMLRREGGGGNYCWSAAVLIISWDARPQTIWFPVCNTLPAIALYDSPIAGGGEGGMKVTVSWDKSSQPKGACSRFPKKIFHVLDLMIIFTKCYYSHTVVCLDTVQDVVYQSRLDILYFQCCGSGMIFPRIRPRIFRVLDPDPTHVI